MFYRDDTCRLVVVFHFEGSFCFQTRAGQICYIPLDALRIMDVYSGAKPQPMCPVTTRITPSKFNMEPENDCFEKESHFPGADFHVNHVKLQGCIRF